MLAALRGEKVANWLRRCELDIKTGCELEQKSVVTAQRKKRVSATRRQDCRICRRDRLVSFGSQTAGRIILIRMESPCVASFCSTRQGNDRVCLPIRSAMALRMSAWSVRRIDGEEVVSWMKVDNPVLCLEEEENCAEREIWPKIGSGRQQVGPKQRRG